MTRLLRSQSILLSALLVLAVTTLLFALASRWYAPGAGTFGAVAAGFNAWFTRAFPSDVALSAGRSLAAQAGVNGVVLVLAAALNSAFLVLLAVGIASLLGVPAGFWIAIHFEAKRARPPVVPRRAVVQWRNSPWCRGECGHQPVCDGDEGRP